jgi:hypothetical protein
MIFVLRLKRLIIAVVFVLTIFFSLTTPRAFAQFGNGIGFFTGTLFLLVIAIIIIPIIVIVLLAYFVWRPSLRAVNRIASQPALAICPYCGVPLQWIPQYQRWFCYREQRYV